MVAVEHGIRRDVLKRWLQLPLNHDVLLHQLYLPAFFALLLCYLLHFVDRDRVVAVVNLVVELECRLSLRHANGSGSRCLMHFIIDWKRKLVILRCGISRNRALPFTVVHPESFVVLHLGLAIVAEAYLHILISEASPFLKRGSPLVDCRSDSSAGIWIEFRCNSLTYIEAQHAISDQVFWPLRCGLTNAWQLGYRDFDFGETRLEVLVDEHVVQPHLFFLRRASLSLLFAKDVEKVRRVSLDRWIFWDLF